MTIQVSAALSGLPCVKDGHQVDTLGNKQQALTAFGRHRPEALVLDLKMPAWTRRPW